MTTARDLLTITMDLPSEPSVRRGDLSLGLAAAELIDLLRLDLVQLAADRVLPVAAAPDAPEVADPLLAQAAEALVRKLPFETVEDWLWRRGRGLPTGYLAALEAEGRLARERRRKWGVLWTSRMVLVDSPDRRRAAHRWSADEPVLVALAAAVGTGVLPAEAPARFGGGVDTVLALLHQALAELAEERLRRARRRDEARVTTLRRGY
ncbi:GPP34 family phosphoprotein [Streptomyces sp. V4-01]|uniref:GPP34 family phosphoprotein n=1 Tax=Actinacidiphila polyblastidii TaxID=3110430 RepID=A0ABU7P9D8_9ACTN|nr:GPP34 family phosphoprotein [Streptomyces sp. V4-01]